MEKEGESWEIDLKLYNQIFEPITARLKAIDKSIGKLKQQINWIDKKEHSEQIMKSLDHLTREYEKLLDVLIKELNNLESGCQHEKDELKSEIQELNGINTRQEQELKDLRVTVNNQKTELIQLTREYNLIGDKLTWLDVNNKKHANKITDEMLSYWENIDDYFIGYNDENDMVFYFREEEKKEELPEAIFCAMKEKLTLENAKRLSYIRINEIKYGSKNRHKIITMKIMGELKDGWPHIKDIYNLQIAVAGLVSMDGDWMSIKNQLSECEWDLSEKRLTPNKMAHNKLDVLIKSNVAEKSQNGMEARIIPTVWERVSNLESF